MKTNPENLKDWTLPAEIPPAFALPQSFRQSLAPEVQEWLNSVEKRIDGLTLERIADEAEELAEEDSRADTLYLLARRLFYNRMQQIVDIMFPDQDIEIGVDLLWGQTDNVLPGFAVSDAVINGEGINTGCLRRLKKAGFTLGGSSLM
jgi:hypothetical protein